MAKTAQVLSDLNETFFDFFDLAVKKFCGSSLALRGVPEAVGRGRFPPDRADIWEIKENRPCAALYWHTFLNFRCCESLIVTGSLTSFACLSKQSFERASSEKIYCIYCYRYAPFF
jgi:hypothetical protein